MDLDAQIPSPEGLPAQEQTAVIATELLREKIRKYTIAHRERNREKFSDSLRFGLGEIRELNDLNEKDVTAIAKRIKRRKRATNEDMYRLSYAFLQGVENIRAFAKLPGAIQVLVKELTGLDSECQVNACECICNLSLGEAPVCEKIVNLAGSYLVTYLDSNEERLKRTSLWTITNIIATYSNAGVAAAGKGAAILMKMELFRKLWHLYVGSEDANVAADCDYREDAGVCLQLIALQATQLLWQADREFLIENLAQKNATCSGGEYYLQIIFHCDIIEPQSAGSGLPDEQLRYLINVALSNLYHCADFETGATRLRVLYAVRILGNLLATHTGVGAYIHQQLATVWQSNFVNVLNKVFEYKQDNLTREALWLLRNLLQQDHQHKQQSAVMRDHNPLKMLKVYFSMPQQLATTTTTM